MRVQESQQIQTISMFTPSSLYAATVKTRVTSSWSGHIHFPLPSHYYQSLLHQSWIPIPGQSASHQTLCMRIAAFLKLLVEQQKAYPLYHCCGCCWIHPGATRRMLQMWSGFLPGGLTLWAPLSSGLWIFLTWWHHLWHPCWLHQEKMLHAAQSLLIPGSFEVQVEYGKGYLGFQQCEGIFDNTFQHSTSWPRQAFAFCVLGKTKMCIFTVLYVLVCVCIS